MIGTAWAQGAGAAPSALLQFLPLIVIFVIFYFLLLRPQQQKQQAHEKMLANLKLQDEVITSGGLYGRIVGLAERIVTLEVATNVRVRVDRPQIATLISPPAAGKKEKDKPK